MDRRKILEIAKWFFVIGVATLIIRNNGYPWFIKRASDIFFLLSLVLVLAYLILMKVWRGAIGDMRNVFLGFILIFSGIFVATTYNYFVHGVGISGGNILDIGRFIEIALIFLLIGFFMKHDREFYKKVAYAQLSTLIYIVALIYPAIVPIDRFQMFENWPSNVGYYLIVSITLIFTLLIENNKFSNRFILLFVLYSGLFGILLWTESRASWVGTILSLVSVIFATCFVIAKKNKPIIIEKIVASFFVMMVIGIVFGFLFLPTSAKKLVLKRFFPQIQINIATHSLSVIERNIIKERLVPDLMDETRLAIYGGYMTLFLKNPLGLGLNYPRIEINGEPKGPHDTLLELLMLGGPLCLYGFLYFVYGAMKNFFISIWKRPYFSMWAVYLFSATLGILSATIFDNMSTFRLLWIILGIGFFWNIKKEKIS